MENSFADALAADRPMLLFGLTPPRATVTPEQADQIADAALRRLEGIPLDALVLYDLDDESDRTSEERPFPFMTMMDPTVFRSEHLSAWDKPTIIYRSVGKYTTDELTQWLRDRADGQPTVLVGASTSGKDVSTSLTTAQALVRAERPDMPMGAVVIPERHTVKNDEHQRLITKQEAGVRFFVSQVVYDVTAAKNMASDYVHSCRSRGITPARVIFTISLCGSIKTLSFLQWLGVDVPRWVQNELTHSADPLGLSVQHALDTARELRSFCDHLGLPTGFNVESVSARKVEIEAAVHVARQIAFEMRRG
ncbi:MAG: methylenetetrahydrofolate reductase [Mobilicoccus sp.]|nr:methylenetetrahydrofolate reductase [Mobilicoccus sp.]